MASSGGAKAGDYRAGAAAGDPVQMKLLGDCYRDGAGGVGRDLAQAEALYRKAASLGHGGAQHSFHRMQVNGASAGVAQSMCNMGVCYRKGWGVTQDFAVAAEWFDRAADKGNSVAAVHLASLYEHGLGVAADTGKAYRLYLAAALAGNDVAQREVKRLETESNVFTWTPAQVQTWLAANQLQSFATLVASMQFDGRMLVQVTDADLKEELRMPFAERKRLLGLIDGLKRASDAMAAAAASTLRVVVSHMQPPSETLGAALLRTGAQEVTREIVGAAAEKLADTMFNSS